MPALNLVLEPDFAYVIAVMGAIFVTNLVLGERVAFARKKFNVRLPQMYGPDNKQGNAFNQFQRGHQNMLETIADTYMLLLVNGLFWPMWTAKCGLAYITGRVLYFIGYTFAPKLRSVGQIFHVPAQLSLLYGMYCAYSQLQSS